MSAVSEQHRKPVQSGNVQQVVSVPLRYSPVIVWAVHPGKERKRTLNFLFLVPFRAYFTLVKDLLVISESIYYLKFQLFGVFVTFHHICSFFILKFSEKALQFQNALNNNLYIPWIPHPKMVTLEKSIIYYDLQCILNPINHIAKSQIEANCLIKSTKLIV